MSLSAIRYRGPARAEPTIAESAVGWEPLDEWPARACCAACGRMTWYCEDEAACTREAARRAEPVAVAVSVRRMR